MKTKSTVGIRAGRTTTALRTLAVAVAAAISLAMPHSGAAQETVSVQSGGHVLWSQMTAYEAANPRAAQTKPQAVEHPPLPLFTVPLPAGQAPTGAASPSGVASRSGAVAPRAPVTPGAPVTTNFQALGDNNTSIPPDTDGAVGPSHLMTMLNSQVRIQDKSGTTLSTVSLSTFWTSTTSLSGSPFDPNLIYDSISDRWIATVDADSRVGTSQVWFAISDGSDPTAGWTFYGFGSDPAYPAGTTWSDFPGLGVNSTWIAITNNMFTVAATPVFAGAKMWVIDKSTALVPGGPITVATFATGFDSSGGYSSSTLRPALTYDAAEPTLYIADMGLSSPSSSDRLIRLSRITGTGAAPAWSVVPDAAGWSPGSGMFYAPTAHEGVQITAPQLGSAIEVETGDGRLLSTVFRNGHLWTTNSGGLPAGSVDRTTVFWYEIDPALLDSTGAPALQSGVFDGGAGVHLMFPSLAVNGSDDVMIGFSRADATRYVEAVYSSRLAADAAGSMNAIAVLKAGEDSYIKDFGKGLVRWGDYSATHVDPSDDTSMWTLQEYAALDVGPAANNDRWGTWWGKMPLTPATTVSTTTISSTTTTTTTTSTTTTTLATPCASTPEAGCRLTAAGKSQLQIKVKGGVRDKFKFKWNKGAETLLSDFKNPVGGSAQYRVCLYDASADPQPLMDMLVLPGGDCSGKPCWKATGSKGYKYKNRFATPDGLMQLKLKAGAAGKAQVQARGAGALLPTPTLPLATDIVVQFLIDDGISTECWQSTFSATLKNDADQVKAKGP